MPVLRRRAILFAPVVALVLLLSGAAAPVLAQQTQDQTEQQTDQQTDQQAGSQTDGQTGGQTGGAAAVSPETLRELVSTIENEEQRQQLLETLRGLIAAQAAQNQQEAAQQESILDRIAQRIAEIGTEVETAVAALPSFDQLAAWAERQYSNAEERQEWIDGIWMILVALAAGFAAEFILRMLLRRPRRRIEEQAGDNVLVRLPYLLIRTILDVIPIAGFAGASYTVLPLLEPSDAVTDVALPLILANVVARAIMAAFRMVLAPNATGLRLVDMPTEIARYLFLWVRRVVNTGVYGYFILVAAHAIGLGDGLFVLLVKLLGLLVAIMLIVFILQNRRDVADWLRGESAAQKARAEETGAKKQGAAGAPFRMLRRRVGDLWHILAILYVLIGYLVWASNIGGGFPFLATATGFTVLAVFLGWLVNMSLQRVLDRALRADPQFKAENPALAEKAERYLPMLRTGVAVIVAAVVLLFILQSWRVDIFGWLITETGRAFIGSVVTIFFLIVGALVIWEVASTLIERYIERIEASQTDTPRASRLTTLLPLARNALLVALSIFVVLTVFSELGVDIGPLLAGAGVIGLAIGFGAQALVKDVITGVFNLIEDTVAVGDVVGVAGTVGVVESVSVRSVKLRAYSGDHYTVPFGEITTVQNYTKEYSCYVFDVGVGYRENVDEVMAVLRELGDEFEKDPDWAPLLLGPLEIPGLQAMGDSAIVVRARYRTTPGNQWAVGREFNRRIKAEFDKRGIEIPFPHMTLYFGEDKEGNAPPAFVQVLDGPKGNGGGPKRKSRVKKDEPVDDSGDPAVMPDGD